MLKILARRTHRKVPAKSLQLFHLYGLQSAWASEKTARTMHRIVATRHASHLLRKRVRLFANKRFRRQNRIASVSRGSYPVIAHNTEVLL